VQRVLWPWNAAALPEIMAGAVQKSKRCVPVPLHEGRAEGKQPESRVGARGGGTAEAKARPNVEVNRRAEGTSELNRRLGAGAKGDWALERCGLPEIMAGALQESKLCVPVPSHEGQAAGQPCRSARVWNGRSQSEA